MEEEKHFPPGAEPAKAPAATETVTPEKPVETPADKGAEPAADDKAKPAPEGDKPKDEGEAEKPAVENIKKEKRSIYDDYKDEKKDRKNWQDVAVQALKAQGIDVKGTETAAELQQLIAAGKDAKTPKEKSEAADDLKTFATKYEMEPEALSELIDLIGKKVKPAAPAPTDLPADIKAKLSKIDEWEARDRLVSEDRAIQGEASTVKTELGISDDKELDAVMKEVIRLSHTERFHDKEVGYILWANKAELGKLVSPKKPSFETGGQHADAPAEDKVDFSTGKVTPQQASKAAQGAMKPNTFVRKSQ